MTRMRIDHVSYAAEHDGMVATAQRLSEALGLQFADGGVHPRFGTRNMVLPLAGGRYLEVVEVLDHPASDKAPFGQAVRARSENGGGWMGWVVAVDDMTEPEARLGRESVPGNRHTPDGRELSWRQIGIKGLIADPQLPFYVKWETVDNHPSLLCESGGTLCGLQIAGDPDRVREWLGFAPGQESGWEPAVDFRFVAPHGTPGLLSVTLNTPKGTVTI